MVTPSRWSIGERMGAGFLLVLLVIASLVVLVGWKLTENDEASAEVEAAIARTQRIDQLERSLLLFAVSTRDALLQRDAASLAAFAASEARLEEAVRVLEQAKAGATTATQLQAAATRIAQYISLSKRVVADGRGDAQELVPARTEALAATHRMLREQEGTAALSLGQMKTNRLVAATTLAAGAAITTVLFVLIALLTVRSIRRPARDLVAVASSLRDGDWQPALKLRKGSARDAATRFEMTQLSHAFAAAAAALESREHRLLAHGEIAKAAGASLDRHRVAESALRSVVEHVGAELGVLYWLDRDSGKLVPLASRAAGASIAAVRVGEGVVGQCARDGEAVLVRDIPADTPFAVGLGFEAARPRAVAAVPILFSGGTVGVLLAAFLREIEPAVLPFLAAAAAQVGVGLMNARAYEEVQELLAQVRRQSEEIHAQNEELQAQGEEIQAQNEQLQVQSEEIQAQNDDLQRHGRELHQQAGALREADERKNEFLGVLAHELRNPLTPIANCVELLRRTTGDANGSGQAHEILARQVQHMTRLIDDLLDVTRISRGKITLRHDRLNLIELIGECLDDQRAAVDQRGIELALELPQMPIHVEGDHTRLCQVFSNLLGNAVKFCPPGSRIAVTVTLDAPAQEVSVHVADDGIGIDAGFLPRIFEPFTQAESELARTKGGLGLGLALAKVLVELHGGRIEARSEGLDRGAEFVVALPLAQAHERAGEPPSTSDVAPASDAGIPKRILVIDDNADGAMSVGELLALEGWQVEVAATARSGLESALRFEPQAILCDIGLPGMDGYQFAREARQHSALRSTFMVALTGYSSPADQRRALDAGFDVHMAKPPQVDALLATLRNAGGKSQAAAGSGDDGAA